MTVELHPSQRRRRDRPHESDEEARGSGDRSLPTVVASFPPAIRTNPYQRLLYDHLAAAGVVYHTGCTDFTIRWLWRARRRIQVLHFHWPHGYYRCLRAPQRARYVASWLKLAMFAVRLAAARALGYRVVWTVHQVLPHEVLSHGLDRAGCRILAVFSTALIAHDEATAAAAREHLFESSKIRVIPHGSYVGVYPDGRGREEVREELGIPGDAFVFLSFGHLRAYKDVELVVQAFSARAPAHAVLVVAGAVMSEVVGRAVVAAAEGDPRIKPCLGFIPNDRVAELFEASDAAVVGRGDGGTSGSLILAMSLGLPAVASDTPSYRALLGGEAAGWLFRAADAESLGDALALAAADPAARAKGEVALARATELDWNAIAHRTAKVLLSR